MLDSSRSGGGVIKGNNFLLHLSLNPGIVDRMALLLENLEFFRFGTPSPLMEIFLNLSLTQFIILRVGGLVGKKGAQFRK